MLKPTIGALALCFVAACGGGGGSSSSGGSTPTASNRAPVANAGSDITQSLSPNNIALDGSNSSDPDGNTLTFSWEITTQPNGGDGALQNATSAAPTLSASVPGDYTVRLTVRDTGGLTSTDTVRLSLSNDAPIISIDPYEQAVLINDNLNFNASGSSDPNGHALTFEWELKSAPGTSTTPTQFSGPTVDTKFDQGGEYILELVVSDGYDQSTLQLDPISALNFIGRTFPGQVTAADYAPQTGHLVIVADTTVSIIADDGTTREVTIGGTGTIIALNNQGTHAAIGYGSTMTLIDLSTAQIVDTWNFNNTLSALMLVDQAYAYGITDSPTVGMLSVVDLSSPANASNTGERLQEGSIGDLHPDDERLYITDPSNITKSINRYKVANGAVVDQTDTQLRYANTYSFCAGTWFSENGGAMLNGCGAILYLDADVDNDLFYSHMLGNKFSTVLSAAHSAQTGFFYVVNENTAVGSDHIEIFDLDTGFEYPSYTFIEANNYYGHTLAARYVFVNPTTGRIHIVASTQLDTASEHMILQGLLPEPSAGDQPPVALVQKNLAAHVNRNVTLDAGSSYDPNGNSLTYTWSLVSQPAGSALTFGDNTQSKLEITPQIEGNYQFSVVVNDGALSSTAASVSVTVLNAADDLVQQLSGAVVDFEYNDVANIGAYIVDADDTLRIVDFNTMIEKIVPLRPFAGSVAISPDGSHVAVSLTGRVTLVSVATGQIVDEVENRTEWGEIVLQDSLVAHQIANRPEFSRMRSIDFNAQTVTEGTGALNDVTMRLHPNGNWVYGVTDETGLIEMAKWDVSIQPTFIQYIKQIEDGAGGEEDLWFTETGDHFLTGSGQLFSSTANQNTDIVDTNTNLEGGVFARSASHSDEDNSWVVTQSNLTPSRILIFEDVGLTQTGTLSSLAVTTEVGSLSTRPLEVYFTETGTQIIGLTQAESDPDVFAVQISDTP